jgi:hypothetical protein
VLAGHIALLLEQDGGIPGRCRVRARPIIRQQQ